MTRARAGSGPGQRRSGPFGSTCVNFAKTTGGKEPEEEGAASVSEVARPPRLQLANGVYHVVSRGNARAAIFLDDADRARFLDVLAAVRGSYSWRILAYCLMQNHYHLLAQTLEPNLAAGMRQLNGVYAQAFNRRHDRVGHLLQGRYGARLIQTDDHLLTAVRYIVRNPVRAGLCASPAGWRFSSHRATLGDEPSPALDVDELLSYFGPALERARERYRELVEAGGDDERPAHPLVEGDEAFAGRMLELLEPGPGLPRRYFRAPRPELSALLAGDDASLALARVHGYSLRQIAAHLGCHASTVSRRLRRGADPAAPATIGT